MSPCKLSIFLRFGIGGEGRPLKCCQSSRAQPCLCSAKNNLPPAVEHQTKLFSGPPSCRCRYTEEQRIYLQLAIVKLLYVTTLDEYLKKN